MLFMEETGSFMDIIRMHNMKFTACHGVLDHEKKQAQDFMVDVRLYLDAKQAAMDDDVEKTVSYADAYETVKRIMTGTPCNLIETLAYKVAHALLREFALLTSVQVEIKKLKPPMEGEFEYMSFSTELKR